MSLPLSIGLILSYLLPMMHRQTPEQQCNVPAAPEGLGRDLPCADVDSGHTAMKRQLETSRLSRSNSFGSLGGLINFVSRLGREDVDGGSQSSDDGKNSAPSRRKNSTPSVDGSSSCCVPSGIGHDHDKRGEETQWQRQERSGGCTGDTGKTSTVALPLSFLFRSNARSAAARRPAVPRRQNSTPNILPSELQLSTPTADENTEAAAETPAIATALTSRRSSLFKHNSDSHLHEMIDDEDIDHVIALKLLLAEAKSEADVAGTQCATLMKKNAYLEQRLIQASSLSEFCIFHVVFGIDFFSLFQ